MKNLWHENLLDIKGAGEMAQYVKCLLNNHTHVSLIPSNHVKDRHDCVHL